MSAPTVNERRAAAIRRHRGKPGVIAALKTRIRAMVEGDRSAKEIGLTVGITDLSACRWIRTLGFRRMYVTDEERAAILRTRQEAQKKAA